VEHAAVKTQTSLSLLNFGQNAIFSGALSAAMVMSAHGIQQARALTPPFSEATRSYEKLTFETHLTHGICHAFGTHYEVKPCPCRAELTGGQPQSQPAHNQWSGWYPLHRQQE
jgi:hypothetical protein